MAHERSTTIVEVQIHPAIGIARVGNSADSFYFGPEVPGTVPRPRGGFKDAAGAIARQAARFRVYGYDRRGRVVREITAADADISWTVSVANTKAAWYRFGVALDLPIAQPVSRRNGFTPRRRPRPPRDRTRAAHDRGPRRRRRSRSAGRVPRRGRSTSASCCSTGVVAWSSCPAPAPRSPPAPTPLRTFSDNDGWADDTCDGPVHASVRLGDRTLDARRPAWLAVTPPNYGPAVASGVVTAYDSARTAWEAADAPRTVRFTADVLPVLARLVDLQWVNTGFLRSNGWGTDGDFLDPDTLDRLARPGRRSAAARRAVFEQFREPTYTVAAPDAVPQIYGDGMTAGTSPNAYQMLAVTPIQ